MLERKESSQTHCEIVLCKPPEFYEGRHNPILEQSSSWGAFVRMLSKTHSSPLYPSPSQRAEIRVELRGVRDKELLRSWPVARLHCHTMQFRRPCRRRWVASGLATQGHKSFVAVCSKKIQCVCCTLLTFR